VSAARSRALGAAQVGLGALLVARPTQVAAEVPSWLVRVLGARGIVQGALTIAAPEPTTLALGASADAAHALSMVPFTIWSHRYRRAAAVSGGTAAVMAVLATALARRDAAAPGQA